MDWSRFRGAAFDALLLTFALGAALAPPDPFTQLLYAGPTFVVALPVLYLYGAPGSRWWKRYLVFVAGLLAAALAWRLFVFAVGPSTGTGVRPAFLLVGATVGTWLAFFGGLETLRGRGSEDAT